MKAIIKRSVTFLLALVISFISVVSFCDVPEAHAAEIATLYTAEEIIATLMLSLGVTIQDYDMWTDGTGALQPDTTSDRFQVIQGGGGSNQEEPDQDPNPSSYFFVPSKQDADATLQLLLEADAARKPDIEAMIETAQKTGKIVINKASGLWEFLKENIGKVVTSLKKPDEDAAMAAYYDMSDLSQSDLSDYLNTLVVNMYAPTGVAENLQFSSSELALMFGKSYYVLYMLKDCYNSVPYTVYGVSFDNYSDLQKFVAEIKNIYVSEDTIAQLNYAVRCFNYNSTTSVWSNSKWSGKVVDIRLLNPNEAHLLQQNYTPNIAAKDNYDRAYDPTSGHMTDIITPSNQIEQKPDGSYDVTGDYVIDMTNPVTYPVDLTDGVTLDDKRTPVTELATVKEPITNPDPDPDTDTDTDPEPEPEPEPEPASLWERLFQWLSKIYNALIRLPQILTNNGLVFGNIVTVLNTISLAVHAIQTAAEGLLSGFDGLEIPDYADLIWELPARFADIIEFPEIDFPEFPEINIPEIPNYLDILKQMLEFLKNLLKLGNIETLLQSMFVFDTAAIALALDELLDVWNFDFLKDLRDKFGAFAFSDDCLYPKIKIARPKIFAPYYKDQYIILCDFADYKSQLSWCRNTIRMMIWIYFIYSIFRHFKVRLSLS